jgi:hypothetical protein
LNIEFVDSHETVYRDGKPAAEVMIAKPVFGDGKGSKRLTAYYDDFEKALCEWLRHIRCPFKDPAEVRFTVTYNDGGILSLYRDISVGHKRMRIADTWKDGYPLTLEKLGFKKSELIRKCCEEGDALARSGYMTLYPEHQKRIKQSFDRRNFYIEPDRLVVFFNPGVIAGKSSGIIQFKTEIDPISLL